jgi:hypothetical protein
MGRHQAQAEANKELAKIAGQLLAGLPVTPAQAALMKEAGLGQALNVVNPVRIFRAAKTKITGALARRAENQLGKTVERAAMSKVPAAASAPAPVIRRRPAGAPKGTPATPVQAGPARATPQQYTAEKGLTSTPRAAPEVRKVQPGRQPGRVVPATPEGSSAFAEGRPAAPAPAATPQQGGPYRTPANQAAPTEAGAPTPETTGGKPGFGWGKALGYGALGLGAYGLIKGVPAAARALSSSSSQPMAGGLGWSPIPYGYGSTPYGDATPNMGFGG